LSIGDDDLGSSACVSGGEKPAFSPLTVLGGLGKGGFATVLLVQDLTTSNLFAMKVAEPTSD
jgi:hypothetical protein